MARRKRNPDLKLVLVGVGAAAAGLFAGYMLASARGALQAAVQWSYWVEREHAGNYVPYIRSPDGNVFQLASEITEAAAEWSAEKAIRERGGDPVPGQPV